MRNPKVFLFDEPLSNLDAALRVATRIEIAQLKERMPTSTMIYVTHDQVEAMTLATRIVVLHGGDIEQVGTPLELYERPANVFVARFIGSPVDEHLQGQDDRNRRRDRGARSRAAAPRTCRSGATPPTRAPRSSSASRPEDLVAGADGEVLYDGEVVDRRGAGRDDAALLHRPRARPSRSSPSCRASTTSSATRRCA